MGSRMCPSASMTLYVRAMASPPYRQCGISRILRLGQSQLNERVGAGLSVEVAARGDEAFELRRPDRQHGDDVANAARLLVEVPDELPAGGLLRVTSAVLRVDRDARAEERHLVRRDERHALH